MRETHAEARTAPTFESLSFGAGTSAGSGGKVSSSCSGAALAPLAPVRPGNPPMPRESAPGSSAVTAAESATRVSESSATTATTTALSRAVAAGEHLPRRGRRSTGGSGGGNRAERCEGQSATRASLQRAVATYTAGSVGIGGGDGISTALASAEPLAQPRRIPSSGSLPLKRRPQPSPGLAGGAAVASGTTAAAWEPEDPPAVGASSADEGAPSRFASRLRQEVGCSEAVGEHLTNATEGRRPSHGKLRHEQGHDGGEGGAGASSNRRAEEGAEAKARRYSVTAPFYAVDGSALAGERAGPGVSAATEGLVGFGNLGNTCFMNSSLQCVLRLRLMRVFLLEHAAPSQLQLQVARKTPITSALHQLACDVFSANSPAAAAGSIAPRQLKSAVASFHRAFSGTEQHDAQEFLRFLLDGMDIECCRIKKKPPYEELKDIEGERLDRTAQRWLTNHLQRNASFIQDIFCGQVVSVTVCSACSHQSVSCDVFHDLSVPIVKYSRSGRSGGSAVSIDDCLASFFDEWTLDPDEHCYICAACKKTQRATRTTKLMRLPQVLVVHLKRFRQQRYLRTKLADVVTFPLEEGGLNVRPLLSPASREENTLYSLSGVVNHFGSCHGGHYTAFCRSVKAGAGKWFAFNDSRVDVVENPATVVSGSAYVLFFERTSRTKL